MLVTIYHVTQFWLIWIHFGRDLKSVTELNAFFNRFLSLDAHYFFDWFTDIKSAEILPKFTGFNLGVIKKILNHVVHDLSCILLNFLTIIELTEDRHALFESLCGSIYRIKIAKLIVEILEKRIFLNVFGNDWI